jgi:hypothetical protein
MILENTDIPPKKVCKNVNYEEKYTGISGGTNVS